MSLSYHVSVLVYNLEHFLMGILVDHLLSRNTWGVGDIALSGDTALWAVLVKE
jgi:hypothetical protein